MLRARRVVIAGLSTCLTVLMLIGATPRLCMAQVMYGSLVGAVKDATGGSIPGATVLVTNKGTGLTREVRTDDTGRYNLTNLPAGVYSFKATMQGFKGFEQTDVTITINSVTRLDVSLEIGSMGDNVTVTAEQAVAADRDGGGAPVNLLGSELTNLPVPLGRNYQQVYRLLPGFAPPANSHSIPTNPARSLEFTVNGTSDDQNNTRIDGVSTANIQLPHVVSYIPTLESIQEVNVVTNSFNAEQGLAGGSAINVQTRSGSNAIHGSGFEYFTNQHLKAWPMRFDDAALNTGPKPDLSYNEFGGTVGGPIKKNKVFYFVSYESIRDHKAVDKTVTRAAARDAEGRSVPLPDAGVRPAFRKSGRHGPDAVPGIPRRSQLRAVQHGHQPGVPEHHSGRAHGSDRPENRQLLSGEQPQSGARQLLRAGSVCVRPSAGRLEVRLQRHLEVHPVGHIRHAALPYERADGVRRHAPWGRPIGGSSNPGHGSGNTYRVTVIGTYTFTPTFLMDAHFGWARQGTNFGAAGPRPEHRP